MDFAGLEWLPKVPFLLFPAKNIRKPNDFDAFKGVFGRCLTLGVGTKGASPRKVSVSAPHEMTGSSDRSAALSAVDSPVEILRQGSAGAGLPENGDSQ